MFYVFRAESMTFISGNAVIGAYVCRTGRVTDAPQSLSITLDTRRGCLSRRVGQLLVSVVHRRGEVPRRRH